jgi:hypothetical protein
VKPDLNPTFKPNSWTKVRWDLETSYHCHSAREEASKRTRKRSLSLMVAGAVDVEGVAEEGSEVVVASNLSPNMAVL